MPLRFFSPKATTSKVSEDGIENCLLQKCTLPCVLYHYKSQSTKNDDITVLSDKILIEQVGRSGELYKPLRDWEIRILALDPGTFGDPLVARLFPGVIAHDGDVVLHLERVKTKYDAISYCWGEAIFDHSITCRYVERNAHANATNDVEVVTEVEYPITSNLYGALQRIRLTDKVRYLWVDQVCINQSDLSERSLQVQKMLLIYKSASNVFVWLGEETVHTELTVHAMQDGIVRKALEMMLWGNRRLLQRDGTHMFCSEHYDAFSFGL